MAIFQHVTFYNSEWNLKSREEWDRRVMNDEVILVKMEKRIAYGTTEITEATYRQYEGRVIRTFSKYDSISEREYYLATVAIEENGKWTFKDVGMDSGAADASPELVAEYGRWVEYNKRRRQVLEKLRERNMYRQHAIDAGLKNRFVAKELYYIFYDQYRDVINLLTSHKNNRLRSEFRKSLAKQIMNWVEGDRKYKSPLSPKQKQYLSNNWRGY